MTGESSRLGRYVVVVWLGLGLSCEAALAQRAPASQASATQASATQVAAAAIDLEKQIQAVIQTLSTNSAADTVRKLSDLLQNDVSKVAASVRVAAYNAVAAANERLAQDARADKLDPAGERNAQKYIDAAVEAYIKAGKAAYAGGNGSSADRAFTKVLGYRSNSADALIGMARVYAATGRPLQSIERYQDYFKASGKGFGSYEPELYVEIGRVYLGANLWYQALRNFNDAVRNGGDTDEVAALMAEAYLGLGKTEDALAQVKKAIERNPSQPLYQSKYAQILLAQKLLPQAAEKAAASLQVARARLRAIPDDTVLLGVMDQCYDVYIKVLNAILAGDPSYPRARGILIECMKEQADVAQLQALHKALAIIRQAPEKDRGSVEMLEKQVLIEKAVSHRDLPQTCERLLRVDPGNRVAKETLAKFNTQPAASAPAPLNIK